MASRCECKDNSSPKYHHTGQKIVAPYLPLHPIPHTCLPFTAKLPLTSITAKLPLTSTKSCWDLLDIDKYSLDDYFASHPSGYDPTDHSFSRVCVCVCVCYNLALQQLCWRSGILLYCAFLVLLSCFGGWRCFSRRGLRAARSFCDIEMLQCAAHCLFRTIGNTCMGCPKRHTNKVAV